MTALIMVINAGWLVLNRIILEYSSITVLKLCVIGDKA